MLIAPELDYPSDPFIATKPFFESFWMAGFEGADHVNGLGQPLDMTRSNDHVGRVDQDYAAAAGMGLRTVRETIGWRLSEPERGRFDLRRALHFMKAARKYNVQIIWTLMHYGTPDDIRITAPDFAERFAQFAEHVARTLAPEFDRPPIYNPINEISFLSWAVSATALIHPYQAATDGSTLGSGYEVKRQLVKGCVLGMKAMRAVDPRARFMHIEPVVHVVAPDDQPELATVAEEVRAYQWQSWDLLCGRLEPELGGTPALLDLIGVNHYHSSQWEVTTERRLDWHLADPRWLPLSDLLSEVWRRYGRPLVIAETSHVGSGRGTWIRDIALSAQRSLAEGVPLHGICLYPAVDRQDWSDANHWHQSGLWDVDASQGMRRQLNFEYAKALLRSQRLLAPQVVMMAPCAPLLR